MSNEVGNKVTDSINKGNDTQIENLTLGFTKKRPKKG